MWKHPSPPAFEDRTLCYHPPCIPPPPPQRVGGAATPEGTFSLGKPPRTASAMATAPLERTRQSPKLITSTCRKVFKVCKEEVWARAKVRLPHPSPPWPSHPESVDTLSSSASSLAPSA